LPIVSSTSSGLSKSSNLEVETFFVPKRGFFLDAAFFPPTSLEGEFDRV